MRISIAVAVLLAGGLLLSSIALVEMEHQHRLLFTELQRLEKERDALDVEWGKLQLEQSTWANHDRIESLAIERLRLRVPPVGEIVLVTP